MAASSAHHVKTSWSMYLEILLKLKDTKIKEKSSQLRQPIIWPSIESGATNAEQTFVSSVKMNRTILVRPAIKLMPRLADSA